MSQTVLAGKNAAARGARRISGRTSASAGLQVGVPHDSFELEADRAADEVMANDTGKASWSLSKIGIGRSLQRKCACGGSAGAEEECEDCRKKREETAAGGSPKLQRRARDTSVPASVPPSVYDVLHSPGQPLGRETRAFFDPRFGRDFSRVRVHTDAAGAKSAGEVNALAYTVGTHVVFGEAQYSSRLLAHELAHVVQQGAAPAAPNSASPSGISRALPDRASLPRLHAERRLQRSPADSKSVEPEATVPGSGPGLIVDDAASAMAPNQMRKSPFLHALRGAVSSVASETVAGRVSGTLGAPALDRVFSSYGRQDASELESNVRQYAPAAASAASARDYISSVVARARSQFEEMRKTGKLPEDADLPGAPADAATSASPAKEASPPLAKKSEMGGSAAAGNTRGIRNQLGGGARIESGLRGRMESAFGTDFGKVRFHTDAAAARTSRNVNARAFTIGRDVAFAAGEYQPGTLIGDALIAHELAHVVQQGGRPEAPVGGAAYNSLEEDADTSAIGAVVSLWGMAKAGIAGIAANALPSLRSGLRLQCCRSTSSALRTSAADFQVTGKENAPGDNMNIYFDFNSSTLDTIEKGKIPNIISAVTPGGGVTLNGFTSEDETASLAGARIAAVDAALAGATPPHSGVRAPAPQPTGGAGHIDYRSVRRVEVLPTAVGSPPPPSAVASCAAGLTAPCGTAFTTAQPVALTMLTAATTALGAAPLAANTVTLLNTLFGGVGVAPTVAGKLGALNAHITAMPSQLRCHNICDTSCTNPAYNCGVGIGVPAADPCHTSGSKAMMTLCPDFLSETDVNKRAQLLIHEGSHGTAGIGAVDIAYGRERRVTALSPAEALRNTDSYVLLVRNIHTPGSVPLGPATPDKVIGGGTCPTVDPAICRALAHLEKWAVTARQDVSGVYGAADNALPPHSWTAGADQGIMHDIAPLFGLTDPGAAAPFTSPVLDDKIKLAGIYDRYDKMMWQLLDRPVTINKVPAGADVWGFVTSAGPATVTLTPAFSAIGSPVGQVRRLYELLAASAPGVTAALRLSYVEAADRIRRRRGYGP